MLNLKIGLSTILVILLLLPFGHSRSVLGAEFPSKPITLIVPSGAGGGHDLTFRAVTSVSMDYLGQPMVVRLMPGGGGAIGSDFVAKAKPDGYTLLAGGRGWSSALPAVDGRSKGPDDLATVCRVNYNTIMLVARGDGPYKNFKELMAWVKANPGKLIVGTGSRWIQADHFWKKLMLERGIKVKLVPYQGGGQQFRAVLGGHSDVGGAIPAMYDSFNWTVENREEFLHAAFGRIPIVREACESSKYNAIILEGGGEPGFMEAREITRQYGIPVTSCAHSQMHVASMLGNKFAVIDFSDVHNMFYHNLVVQHRMTERCASIRNLGYYHAKPDYPGEPSFGAEREKAVAGERSEGVERAVAEAVDAIEEDGADVIMFGCSGAFWLKPFVEKRLHEMGWEVPVLEGYGCAIELAKVMVDMGVTASGLAFPSDRPKKRPRKIVF